MTNELKENTAEYAAMQVRQEELKSYYYRVIHDIKAPIISIIGLVKLSKVKAKDKKTQDFFEEIENYFRQLETEITSSLKSGLIFSENIGTDKVDFNDTLTEVIHLLSYARKMNNVHFHTRISQKKPFNTNRQLMFSILQNIIDNAVKHGRITEGQELNIHVSIKQQKSFIKLKIDDDGKGISESTKKQLFETTGNENDLLMKGNGLGLYIIKKCVDKLNGHLSISRQKGGGTSFEICIPESPE